MSEHKVCENCGGTMTDFSKPQRPWFICEDCGSDDSGCEVEWCEYCGEPFVCGDSPNCDCHELEDGELFDSGEEELEEECDGCGAPYYYGEPDCDCSEEFDDNEDE